MSGRQHLLCGLALVMALCLRFYPTVEAGYVYEDARMLEGVATAKVSDFAASSMSFVSRGLTRITWMAQGHSPLLMHMTNIALHVLCGLTLAWIVLQLAGPVAAWIGATVFLLHPITAEAVNYATGRGELLALAGMLLGCALALTRFWAFAPWLLLLALGGKEHAIMGGVLLVAVVAAARRWQWPALFTLWSNVVLVGALCFAVAVSRSMMPTAEWPLMQASALVQLLTWVVFPVSQVLDFPLALPAEHQLLVGAVVAALATLGFWFRHERPLLLLGVTVVAIGVVPRFVVMSQPTGGTLNLHQFYTAFAGVALIFASVVRSGGIPSQLYEERTA